MGRVPITLWFTTVGVIWRLLALTATVLVAVLAFAAAVKPVTSGELSAVDALRFIGYATLPMSAYALPFACAFASTLAYHRLAQDNELTAAQASGISLRMLLMPAAVTGLVVAGALAALNEQLIPRFLRQMQEIVKADVGRILATNIERGRQIELENVVMTADRAETMAVEPGSGADQHVVLSRVSAVRLDKDLRVAEEAFSQFAHVWVFRPSGGSERSMVLLRLENAVIGSPGMLMKTQAQEWTLAGSGGLLDDPKFLTWGELRELRRRPERLNWMDGNRKELAYAVGEQIAGSALARTLETQKRARFTDAAGNTYVVRAAGVAPAGAGRAMRLVPIGDAVEVERAASVQSGRAGVTKWSARTALIEVSSGIEPVSRSLAFGLKLEDAQAEGGSARVRVDLPGLRPDPSPMERLLAMNAAGLLEESGRVAKESGTNPGMERWSRTIGRDLGDLSREITSKQQERMAQAASCFVMVLTGAVVAVRLSRSSPLTVYMWTFFPALISIITIAGGQNLTHNIGNAGLGLMWAGVAGLAVYTMAVYHSLARH